MRFALLLSVSALTLAACADGGGRREPAPVEYKGSQPTGQQQAAAAPAPAPVPFGEPDARGLVRYDGYETVRARAGDTVDSMARRVGLTGSELAAYNGLSTQYQPQAGDELVLPARRDAYQGTQVAAATPAPAPAPERSPFIQPDPALQPPQQTGAPSSVEAQPLGQGDADIPSTYQPSVASPDDQTTVAAAPQPAPEASQPAPTPSDTGWSVALAREAIVAPSEPAPEPQPEPVLAPTQPAPAPAAPAAAPAPASAEPTVTGAVGGVLLRPTTAPVSRPFSRAPGPDRNDGVDFATVAGDAVAAAEDGTVALVSKSLGGLGTIVLIRHDNQLLTVYGRIDSVTVKKGDRVSRGQPFATVADIQSPRKPHLHFEVRQGAESVDPMQFF